MKKIICLLIIVGLGSYYGGEILAQHKVPSQNDSAALQVNTANNQQDDDSEDQTNNTPDTSTNTPTSNVDIQNSDTDNSANNNTNIDTPNRSSSGKLTSPDGYLELESKKGNYDNITGTIKNLSPEPYSYVEVDINLYDDNGNQVESTLANTNNLEGNGTWNFSAPVLYPDKSSKLKIISIKGMR